jgi:hypothetical protein
VDNFSLNSSLGPTDFSISQDVARFDISVHASQGENRSTCTDLKYLLCDLGGGMTLLNGNYLEVGLGEIVS